jgi:hypothetical protein
VQVKTASGEVCNAGRDRCRPHLKSGKLLCRHQSLCTLCGCHLHSSIVLSLQLC